MPRGEIRTTIALDGEKEFKRALSDARREMTVMGSELKAAREEFNNTGNEQKFMTTKTKVLGQQMAKQKQVVQMLEKEVGEMAKKHGQASREVQEMTIQLNNATGKLNRIEREFRDATKYAKDLGRGLDKNVEKEAKASAKAVDDLSDKLDGLQGDVGKIKSMGGIELGMDILGNAKDWAQQFMEWGKEGRNYLRQEVMTQYQAERAGIRQEFVDEQINRVGAIIGDREEARAGVSTLLNIEGIDEKHLKTYIDYILGIYLRESSWASFSGLAEGKQQTLSNRELDGQMKEALERGGFKPDEIEALNKQMLNAPSQRDAGNILLTALTGKGYLDMLARYENENKKLIQAEFAEQSKERALNDLKSADVLQDFSKNVDLLSLIGLDALKGILTGQLGTEFEKQAQKMRESQPGYEYWKTHEPRNWYERQLSVTGGMLPEGYRPEDVVDNPFSLRHMWSLFRGTVTEWGAPTGKAINPGQKLFAPKSEGFGGSFLGEAEPTWMIREAFVNSMQGAGTEMLQNITQELESQAAEDAKTGGEAIGNGLKAGLEISGAEAVTAARSIASSITAELSRIAVPNIPSMVAAAGGYSIGGALTNVAVNLDGRKVGQLVTPYVSKAQGRTV